MNLAGEPELWIAGHLIPGSHPNNYSNLFIGISRGIFLRD